LVAVIAFERIYQQFPEAYEAMVSREDHEGNILRTVQSIRPLQGLSVVELGAGTGRLTRLIAPHARSILACDRSAPMLKVAGERLAAGSPPVWRLALADNRRLPASTAAADLVLAGWSLGHAIEWSPAGWQGQIEEALKEMRRVARPGGTLLILETLGTGEQTPRPPTEGLARYYEMLEAVHGFQRRWVRTDYAFDSPAQAAESLRFFFGDGLADRALQEGLTIVPECTGFWFKRT
jgi:ubiquinone/menaquinone biosynthesis C-methylase UbiE